MVETIFSNLILDMTDFVYCTGRLHVYPSSAGKLDIHGHQKYNSPQTACQDSRVKYLRPMTLRHMI